MTEAAGEHAELGRLVRDALMHLYDPVYLQTHPLVKPRHGGFAAVGAGPWLFLGPSGVRAPLGKAFASLLTTSVTNSGPSPFSRST